MRTPALLTRRSGWATLAVCAALLLPPAVSVGQPATPLPLTGEFEPGRALGWLYDGIETKGDRLIWESPDAGLMAVRVLADLPFEQNGTERRFLVAEFSSATEGSTSRATPAGVGAATFSRIENGWRLDARNPHVVDLGSDGRAPKPMLAEVGPEKHGLVFHSMGMGQGSVEMAATYVLEAGETLQEALRVYTGSNNSGACDPEGLEGRPCYNYESTLEFVPGDDPVYFDLKVTIIGTHDESREESVYVLADGAYKKKSP